LLSTQLMKLLNISNQSNWAVAETAAYKAKEATKLSTLTWCIADPRSTVCTHRDGAIPH
jgi:hypothetical protein